MSSVLVVNNREISCEPEYFPYLTVPLSKEKAEAVVEASLEHAPTEVPFSPPVPFAIIVQAGFLISLYQKRTEQECEQLIKDTLGWMLLARVIDLFAAAQQRQAHITSISVLRKEAMQKLDDFIAHLRTLAKGNLPHDQYKELQESLRLVHAVSDQMWKLAEKDKLTLPTNAPQLTEQWLKLITEIDLITTALPFLLLPLVKEHYGFQLNFLMERLPTNAKDFVAVSRVLGLLGGAPPLWPHESEYVDYYLLENSPHLRAAIEEAERAYADGRVMSLEEFERELIGGRN